MAVPSLEFSHEQSLSTKSLSTEELLHRNKNLEGGLQSLRDKYKDTKNQLDLALEEVRYLEHQNKNLTNSLKTTMGCLDKWYKYSQHN